MSQYFPTRDEMTARTVFERVRIRTCAGDHMQFSLAEIPDGVEVPPHSHINEQMGIILTGTLRFTIADETKLLSPGDVFCVPGGVTHSVLAVGGPVTVLDVFWPIREEYR